MLPHHAAVLTVLSVIPQRVPAPLPLQRPTQVNRVQGEAPGLVLLTSNLVEDVQGVGGILNKSVIAGQRLGPPTDLCLLSPKISENDFHLT